MRTEEKESIESRAKNRGETVILDLKRREGRQTFRYAVAAGGDSPLVYSIYAQWEQAEQRTVGVIPMFSVDRMQAEQFCRLLERTLATPLSLEALYEDSLTP